MKSNYTCIAVDDDPLFLRSLEVFLEEIEWIQVQETFNNPIKAAKAIISAGVDIVFLDYEMPNVDGDYLLDWLQPKLKAMENPPTLILISSVDSPPSTLLDNVTGFINKSKVNSRDSLEMSLKEILD